MGAIEPNRTFTFASTPIFGVVEVTPTRTSKPGGPTRALFAVSVSLVSLTSDPLDSSATSSPSGHVSSVEGENTQIYPSDMVESPSALAPKAHVGVSCPIRPPGHLDSSPMTQWSTGPPCALRGTFTSHFRTIVMASFGHAAYVPPSLEWTLQAVLSCS